MKLSFAAWLNGRRHLIFFSVEHGLGKLGAVIDPWGDISREMISSARKTIDGVLCKESDACFNGAKWMELMKADGVRFEDAEKVGWAMATVLRGAEDAYAPLYQVSYPPFFLFFF